MLGDATFVVFYHFFTLPPRNKIKYNFHNPAHYHFKHIFFISQRLWTGNLKRGDRIKTTETYYYENIDYEIGNGNYVYNAQFRWSLMSVSKLLSRPKESKYCENKFIGGSQERRESDYSLS